FTVTPKTTKLGECSPKEAGNTSVTPQLPMVIMFSQLQGNPGLIRLAAKKASIFRLDFPPNGTWRESAMVIRGFPSFKAVLQPKKASFSRSINWRLSRQRRQACADAARGTWRQVRVQALTLPVY